MDKHIKKFESAGALPLGAYSSAASQTQQDQFSARSRHPWVSTLSIPWNCNHARPGKPERLRNHERLAKSSDSCRVPLTVVRTIRRVADLTGNEALFFCFGFCLKFNKVLFADLLSPRTGRTVIFLSRERAPEFRSCRKRTHQDKDQGHSQTSHHSAPLCCEMAIDRKDLLTILARHREAKPKAA
jgi:hypothetical protein